MDDLVQWLRAQIDDDERIANAATSGPWFVHDTYLNRGGYAATVLSGEIGHGELRAWLPTMRGDVPWDDERNVWNDAKHIARYDPARVLREVEAKRQILAPLEGILYQVQRKEEVISEEWDAGEPIDRETSTGLLKLLALPYSDRPGYREEWRP